MKHYTFTFTDIDTLIILQALAKYEDFDGVGALDKAEAKVIEKQIKTGVLDQEAKS